MKIILLVITTAFLAIEAHSHSSIKGKVYSKNSMEPLPYASIREESTGKIVSSDELGNYSLTQLDSGAYTLTISSFGYKTEQITVKVNRDEEVVLNIYLTESIYKLPEITLSEKKDLSSAFINQADIGLRPYNSSQELLTMVPGLFIAQHAGGGKAEQIFLRGFDIDHGTDINLTVDGVPVNMVSHAHGQGYSDLHFLIPETIERIDYSKGPYEASKGDFATAGTVGFVTQNNPQSNLFKLEAGRFSTLRATYIAKLIDRKDTTGSHFWYLAGENLFSQGYFESPQNLKRLNIFSKYTGTFRNGFKFSLSGSVFQSSWNASGQIPERAVENGLISRFGSIDDTEGGTTTWENVNLIITKNITRTSSFNAQFYFTHYTFDLFSNFSFFLNDSINGDQIGQKENRILTGSNFSYSNAYSIGKLEARNEIGAGIRSDDVNDISLTRTIKRNFLGYTTFGDIKQANPYIYVKENLFLSRRLSMEAGMRYDLFFFNYLNKLDGSNKSSSSGILSPKLSFLYTHDKSKQFFLKAGSGFHSKDARAAVYSPEIPRALGAEIGSNFKLVKKTFTTVTCWYLELENEFVYVGDEGIIELAGRSRRWGVDLSVRHQIGSFMYLNLDVNASDPKFIDEAEGENYIPLAPTFTSTAGLNFKFKNGFSGSLSYRFIGDRAANENNSLTAEGYFLTDAVINYTRKKFTAGICIQNLFNQTWREAQFETTSRLQHELQEYTEVNYTPGSPLFIKTVFSYKF